MASNAVQILHAIVAQSSCRMICRRNGPNDEIEARFAIDLNQKRIVTY